MRENGIDMWIVAMKEGHYDPLWELLGRGYVGSIGYYIFTDRGGDRIERAAIGITDHHRNACGAYDKRSEEHTSELQSQSNLVCRLLLEKKNSQNKLYK